MALSENKLLASIEILPSLSAINVRWETQILRNGEIISTENVRRAYGRYEREQFLVDVPGGDAYADSAGLESSANTPVLEVAAE